MSIIRPTPSQMTRRLIVLASALFGVLVAQAQMLLGWGQTQAEFAADSDATLKVAGYAFSIWGVIYLGLLVYAVRQALPQTGESVLINRMGWPSVVAFFGIGMWIIAAALNLKAASVGSIFASLLGGVMFDTIGPSMTLLVGAGFSAVGSVIAVAAIVPTLTAKKG